MEQVHVGICEMGLDFAGVVMPYAPRWHFLDVFFDHNK